MTQRGKDLTEHGEPGAGDEQGGGKGGSRDWNAESSSFNWESRSSNRAAQQPEHDQPAEGGVEQVETGDAGAQGGNPSGV